AKGGVIQINFGSSFLTEAANRNAIEGFKAITAFQKEKGVDAESEESKAFEAEWKKAHPLPRATLDDVVAHIDHVVELVGVDHVGLGSDFDGVGDSLPEGLKDVSTYPNLFARLLARGYTDSDIEKIAGGNLMRVWREAERVARVLQGG
ncbi:MAG: membrane dipeptidase, partial [Thermoanaerobaculia bacterium]